MDVRVDRGEFVCLREPEPISNSFETGLLPWSPCTHVTALMTQARALNAARLPLREQSLLASGSNQTSGESAATMTIQLGLDFRAAGGEGSQQRAAFVRELVQDLAYASGLMPQNFSLTSLSPGSIMVDAAILGVPNPETVAAGLEAQVYNPRSPLRSGAITRFAQAVKLAPASDMSALPLEIPVVASALRGAGNLFIRARLEAEDEKALSEMEEEAKAVKSEGARWADAALALALAQGADSGGERALKESMDKLEKLNSIFEDAQQPAKRAERRRDAQDRAGRVSKLYTKDPWYLSGAVGKVLPEPEEDYPEREVEWVTKMRDELSEEGGVTLRKAAEELARAQEIKAMKEALAEQSKRDEEIRATLGALQTEAGLAGSIVPSSLLGAAVHRPETATGACQTADTHEILQVGPGQLMPGFFSVESPWTWSASGRVPSPQGGIIRRLGTPDPSCKFVNPCARYE